MCLLLVQMHRRKPRSLVMYVHVTLGNFNFRSFFSESAGQVNLLEKGVWIFW